MADNTVLLVDDDAAITDNLSPFLSRSGYDVVVAHDGLEGLEKVRDAKPNLIITDVMMPRMDGREFLRRLRQEGNWTPVILLTRVGEASERAMALEEGADDYLNKPFDPHELVARIRAVLRRAKPNTPPLATASRLQAANISIARLSRRAYLGRQEITLTPKAFTLLEYLMTHPDEVLTRERLLDVCWGWDYPVGTRAVDTRIAELRRKLQDDSADPQYIETVPGVGYRFVSDVQGAE
jgi:DNA-binding response OmpR family regulator